MDNSKGFTLLELLIAVTILGVVSAVLYGVLRSGLDAHARGSQETEEIRDAYGFFGLLRDDIKNSLAGQDSVVLQGATLAFKTVEHDSKSIAEVRYSMTAEGIVRQLIIVSDQADKQTDTSSVVLPETFSAEFVPLSKGRTAGTGGDMKEEIRADGVSVRLTAKESGKQYEEIFGFAYIRKNETAK